LFGEPWLPYYYADNSVAGYPQIAVVPNFGKAKAPAEAWHTDWSHMTTPPTVSIAMPHVMPEYGGDEGGVKVGSVRDGGAADVAGIEAGDVLVALNGTGIKDIEHYTELLDALTIGKAATVRVRREGAEVDLQVIVGSRPRSR
jgi:PDZ domain-containing secreted protein